MPSVICCCGMRFGDGARFEFPLQLSSPWRELGPPLVLYGVMKRERERGRILWYICDMCKHAKPSGKAAYARFWLPDCLPAGWDGIQLRHEINEAVPVAVRTE